MAGGAALSAPLPPAVPAEHNERMQQAVALNAERLQYIVCRIKEFFRRGLAVIPNNKDFAGIIYAFSRGIDYALSADDIPNIAGEIPEILRKVYQLRNDPFLQSPVMVLMISCKNACHNKWFQPSDFIDILRMADELSGNFCSPFSQPDNASTVLEIISTIMPRYYPRLKFERLIISLEAKVGYDILMTDFFIKRDLPQNEKICLIVVQKENLDASSCITSPQHVSFLVNGKGVDKRTNVSMETGPQFPTDITKMLKYGANILQAVGYFNANYIIAVAFVNFLTSFDAPKLDDYAQPVTADVPDSDILEGPSRVSLKCPISLRRIKTPTKGRLCKHYQCFDYDNYMDINLRKPTWRCPVCSTPSNFTELRIDQKMSKVLRETGDDIIDVLMFPDGSWKAVSVHDEKSDRHSGDVIHENGDTLETDATPSDVIDLINGNDDCDLLMDPISASEDMKPLLDSQDLSVADYVLDVPISTTAQPENLYVRGGDTGSSIGTSTSGQNSLLSSTSGTLESILPRSVMQAVTADAVSPFETSNSIFAIQQFSQGAYPDLMRMQSSIDPSLGSEVAQLPMHRNIRRDPTAVQGLAVPLQNSGSSRRVQPNVVNRPPPTPHPSSAPSYYRAHQATNSNNVNTSMNTGVVPPSRAHDAISLLHRQSTQQWLRNTPTPSHAANRIVGLVAPQTMGTGQATGANAYGLHAQQQQQFRDHVLNSLVRSQAVPQPATPQATPRVQSPGLPSAALTPSATHVATSDGLQELTVDENWRPSGQMRGSLTGPAYSQAIERYLTPSGGPQTS